MKRAYTDTDQFIIVFFDQGEIQHRFFSIQKLESDKTQHRFFSIQKLRISAKNSTLIIPRSRCLKLVKKFNVDFSSIQKLEISEKNSTLIVHRFRSLEIAKKLIFFSIQKLENK